MTHLKIVKKEIPPPEEKIQKLNPEDAEDTKQRIEEAAYYIGLNRVNNSQAGDELNDWFEAERAVQENFD
jgi:hypothetical protein